MSFRVEIGLKRGVRDPRGERAAAQARSALHLPVRGIRTRDVYRVDAELSPAAQARVRDAFSDPVLAVAALGRLRPPAKFDWLIEVGYKPGVTDNVGATARTVMADVLGGAAAGAGGVYSSIQYFVQAPGFSREQARTLATGLLANELIQTVGVHAPEEWAARAPDAESPVIREPARAQVRTIPLEGGDAALLRISREGTLSLSLEEMQAIRDHYRRPETRAARAALGLPPEAPTDVELECLAQTWSEHCKHKIFAARVRYTEDAGHGGDRRPLPHLHPRRDDGDRARDRLARLGVHRQRGHHPLQRPLECGVQVRDAQQPSALDPYGGAITGIVGVNRDPMGTGIGCELLYNVWGYCLASPFHDGDAAGGADASAAHPRRRAPRRDRRRQPERHPVGARLRAVRRPLSRQAAGLLRHRRPHPARAARHSDREEGHPPRRRGGDVRGADRQGRHPRRDLLLRGTACRIARAGGADRRRVHPAQAVRIHHRGARSRPLPRADRQRRGRAELVHRRDVHAQRRGRA
jgi:phosphoribosylformylglycinamidine synthase subunit PurSL